MKFQVNKNEIITDFTLHLEKQYKNTKLGFKIETSNSLIETVDYFNSYISFNLDKLTLSKLKLKNLIFDIDPTRFINLDNLKVKDICKYSFDKNEGTFYILEGECSANYINNHETIFYIVDILKDMSAEELNKVYPVILNTVKNSQA